MTTTRLRALFAAQGIALGVLMPFLVPVLVDRGLGPAEIGLALGASGLASLLAYPMWGAIADGGLGRRRTIGLTSLTAALGGLLLLTAGSDPFVIALALSNPRASSGRSSRGDRSRRAGHETGKFLS